MSNNPADQQESDKTQDAEGTGIYDASQFAAPAPQSPPPDFDGTGEWTASGEPAGSKSPPFNEQPVSLPGTLNARDAASEVIGGGTALFVPQVTAEPGEAASMGTVDLPASHGVTGEYDPNAPVAPPSSQQKAAAPTAGRCGRYDLKRFHAKGGMGEIWLAEDPAIGRSVALKRILAPRPDRQRRFLVEAQVTGQLEHPGIVPVHELGVNEKGQPFYTMKFVRGRTLQKVVAEFHAISSPTARHAMLSKI